ncbi:hypothetical protein [Hyunsoonleella aestuarii]|uniref:hypothetical protein n=1 Tax=Hyunsoonleella aestuarii TaxID=912802 RepID=UPI001111464D|nr:hypothetical protein [Hyunsoonleella aestuarii]
MFKQRKHRTFNYKPRFSHDNEHESIDKSVDKPDFVSRWKELRPRKRRGTISLRTLIIVLVLLLICMFWLESKIN